MVCATYLGYDVLEMEKELFNGLDSKKSKNRLSDVSDIATNCIRGLKEPKSILTAISNILANAGYSYGNDGTFHNGLEKKTLDCRDYMYVFMTIAERNNLPLHAVLAPAHVFVRWQDQSSKINWETTSGIEFSDEVYKHKFNIHESSVLSGYLMKNLSRESIFAIPLHNLGMILIGKHQDYAKALEYHTRAIESNPTYDLAWCGKGVAYNYLQNSNKAIECYEESIRINPNFADPWHNLGATYNDLKEYEKAIKHFDETLKLDSHYVSAWKDKGVVYQNLRKYAESKECFAMAEFLEKELAQEKH